MLHVNSCEKQFTKVYFVRHAQAEHSEDDRTRPLTAEGGKGFQDRAGTVER